MRIIPDPLNFSKVKTSIFCVGQKTKVVQNLIIGKEIFGAEIFEVIQGRYRTVHFAHGTIIPFPVSKYAITLVSLGLQKWFKGLKSSEFDGRSNGAIG